MITVFKSKNTQTVHIGTISSSAADDYVYSRIGNEFNITRNNTAIPDIVRTDFSKIQGKDDNGNLILFNTALELEQYLESIFKVIPNDLYCPAPILSSIKEYQYSKNSTFEIDVTGEFLDQINNISVTSLLGKGTVSINSFQSIGHKSLIINCTASNDVGFYELELEGICSNLTLPLIEVLDISTIVPSNVGNSNWIKLGNNNNVTTSTGTFESQDSNGNGWNDHAAFGGISSSKKIKFSMKIDKLFGASSAYCFIRFDGSNNPSTIGNPRIYINNGSSFYVYNSLEEQTVLPTLKVADIINIDITPTEFSIILNGTEIYNHLGTYNLNNIYATFTAYRTIKLSEISAQIFN